MKRRHLAPKALFTFAGLSVASPAFAHIDPDPTDAQACSEVSVGFTVQHGCDGSPTIQLDVRLPDGVLGIALTARFLRFLIPLVARASGQTAASVLDVA